MARIEGLEPSGPAVVVDRRSRVAGGRVDSGKTGDRPYCLRIRRERPLVRTSDCLRGSSDAFQPMGLYRQQGSG